MFAAFELSDKDMRLMDSKNLIICFCPWPSGQLTKAKAKKGGAIQGHHAWHELLFLANRHLT